ncbi:2-oxo-4-hydroxy-4-carboxy-5-ureidoimidazoline decarboxylase [Streptomyces sp. ODS28]|uniref:2-oxo-4-hydroxy-4-carboxy-5-ureidoimidazoline decarboxylase n=1 Tax=Streptomyces sp. ODS28 TaxID=3136688 RepID=UPI0031ED4C06
MPSSTDRTWPRGTGGDGGVTSDTRGGEFAGIEGFNAAPPAQAEEALGRCCGSRRWAARLTAHRPYPDLDALLAAADEASYDLTAEDLGEALAEESAQHPLSDQPGLLAAHTALRAAHAAYESRFGHAFVICLDGWSRDERLDQVLAGIRGRLGNDPEREREATAEELRRLARGRLTRLVGPD